MRLFFLLFMACALLGASITPALARDAGIAAVVNQDAISMNDLTERMKLIMVSSGLPDTPEIRAKVAEQVIQTLIEEQLMLQEAAKQKISVSDQEIDQGFAQLAQQNKFTSEQFAQMIAHAGIDISTMRQQIKAQLSWSKVIQKAIRPQISVTDADIDEYLARIAANKGKTENLVAEIFLPVDSPNQEADARQLADRLVSEMRAGKAPFPRVAQQFSKAPGASQGGVIGWVQEGQLPQELDEALAQMKPDSLSPPVRTANGYHILYLRDQRVISDQSMPTRDQAMEKIGVERLDRAQRRYLMDLKSAAFIENRVQS